MRLYLRALAAVAAGAVVSGPALAGPDWIETGDAGSTLATAQRVVGTAQLSRIIGTLSSGSTGIGNRRGTGPDYEDLYLIRITAPSSFSFQVGGAAFNAQLFLFNVTLPGEALGLLAADDTPVSNAPLLISPATDATGAQVVLPGVYAMGITGFGRVPVSSTGPIFSFASPTEISGPDGPGGTNPLMGWEGVGETGTYVVGVQGVDWVDIPAPASAMVLLLAGLCSRGRRRG